MAINLYWFQSDILFRLSIIHFYQNIGNLSREPVSLNNTKERTDRLHKRLGVTKSGCPGQKIQPLWEEVELIIKHLSSQQQLWKYPPSYLSVHLREKLQNLENWRGKDLAVVQYNRQHQCSQFLPLLKPSESTTWSDHLFWWFTLGILHVIF